MVQRREVSGRGAALSCQGRGFPRRIKPEGRLWGLRGAAWLPGGALRRQEGWKSRGTSPGGLGSHSGVWTLSSRLREPWRGLGRVVLAAVGSGLESVRLEAERSR